MCLDRLNSKCKQHPSNCIRGQIILLIDNFRMCLTSNLYLVLRKDSSVVIGSTIHTTKHAEMRHHKQPVFYTKWQNKNNYFEYVHAIIFFWGGGISNPHIHVLQANLLALHCLPKAFTCAILTSNYKQLLCMIEMYWAWCRNNSIVA